MEGGGALAAWLRPPHRRRVEAFSLGYDVDSSCSSARDDRAHHQAQPPHGRPRSPPRSPRLLTRRLDLARHRATRAWPPSRPLRPPGNEEVRGSARGTAPSRGDRSQPLTPAPELSYEIRRMDDWSVALNIIVLCGSLKTLSIEYLWGVELMSISAPRASPCGLARRLLTAPRSSRRNSLPHPYQL